MLRRQPTGITLRVDDVAEYDDRREQLALAAEQTEGHEQTERHEQTGHETVRREQNARPVVDEGRSKNQRIGLHG
jgi:hypothetical protein